MTKILNLTNKKEADVQLLPESELHEVSLTTNMKFGTTENGIDVIQPLSSKLNTNNAGKKFIDELKNNHNEQSNLMVSLHIANAIASLLIANERMLQDEWNVDEQLAVFFKVTETLRELPAMQTLQQMTDNKGKKH